MATNIELPEAIDTFLPVWARATDPDGLSNPIKPLEIDSHGQLVGQGGCRLWSSMRGLS
jgi:hypothetical protein